MYKVHHNKVPAIFSTFFVKNREIHNYPTSSRNKFHVPLAKSYYTAKIVRITGVTTSNYLFDRVGLNVTYTTYKSNLKKFLVENNVILVLLCNHLFYYFMFIM